MAHIWESEQIQSALNKFRDKHGWIKSREIRDTFSGIYSAQECRELMRILVESYGAFGNGEELENFCNTFSS